MASSNSATVSDLTLPKVCVVGLGYIGLPTAVTLAQHGFAVHGYDVKPDVVDCVRQGQSLIIEPGLAEALSAVYQRDDFTVDTVPAFADVFLITVPTPLLKLSAELHDDSTRRADLSYIMDAIENIAPVLQPGNLVILESTSPVGTAAKVVEMLARLRPDLQLPSAQDSGNLAIAYCPERVIPGRTMHELIENDRCIGGVSAACAKQAQAFYQQFVHGECVLTTAKTAELSKLVENAYRDVNIAFANELSFICDQHDIDVWELIGLANRHPRVNILQPGPGVGGHCIAVDPWFIVGDAGVNAKLITSAREVNDSKPAWVVSKFEQALERVTKDSAKAAGAIEVLCMGLSFKPDIGDLRGSPALAVVNELAQKFRGHLRIAEPHIKSLDNIFFEPKATLSLVAGSELTDALRQADIVLVLVDHSSFKHLQKPGAELIDTRGLWR